ncbi:hypothetical protein T09_680 [Trichinella sp. T9]|nr:hypothetical protein T09_680 [Trichinella sp. T9]
MLVAIAKSNFCGGGAFPTLVCSFWPSVNHRVDLVPWDFLVSFYWNGLTDRTSCFDRKLCTDLSWLCETSRFCSTETGVCGLMIHSLLGKLLNLSSLLTTPTVVQNCRCCVLSALSSSSSSSSSSSCDFSAANITD